MSFSQEIFQDHVNALKEAFAVEPIHSPRLSSGPMVVDLYSSVTGMAAPDSRTLRMSLLANNFSKRHGLEKYKSMDTTRARSALHKELSDALNERALNQGEAEEIWMLAHDTSYGIPIFENGFASMVAARACRSSLGSRPAYLLNELADSFFRNLSIPIKPDNSDVVISVASSSNLMENVIQAALASDSSKDVVLFPKGDFYGSLLIPEEQGAALEMVSTPSSGESKGKLRAEELEKALIAEDGSARKDVSCLVFTNPTMPSGQVYTQQELKDICRVAVRHGVKLVVDQIHYGTHFDAPFTSAASLTVEIDGQDVPLHEHVMTVTGGSKLYLQDNPKVSACASGDGEWIDTVQKLVKRGHHDRFNEFASMRILPAFEEDEAQLLSGTRRYHLAKARGFERLLNEHTGEKRFGVNIFPTATQHAMLEFDAGLMETYGIMNSQDLMQYVYLNTGVQALPLSMFGLDTLGLRINFAHDTTIPNSSDVTTKNASLQIGLTRIDDLLEDMAKGMAPTMQSTLGYLAKRLEEKQQNDFFSFFR